jgi:hypothetical protein
MSAKALTPQEFFTRLNKDTMDLVAEFYAPHAHFQDPVVNVTGAVYERVPLLRSLIYFIKGRMTDETQGKRPDRR